MNRDLTRLEPRAQYPALKQARVQILKRVVTKLRDVGASAARVQLLRAAQAREKQLGARLDALSPTWKTTLMVLELGGRPITEDLAHVLAGAERPGPERSGLIAPVPRSEASAEDLLWMIANASTSCMTPLCAAALVRLAEGEQDPLTEADQMDLDEWNALTRAEQRRQRRTPPELRVHHWPEPDFSARGEPADPWEAARRGREAAHPGSPRSLQAFGRWLSDDQRHAGLCLWAPTRSNQAANAARWCDLSPTWLSNWSAAWDRAETNHRGTELHARRSSLHLALALGLRPVWVTDPARHDVTDRAQLSVPHPGGWALLGAQQLRDSHLIAGQFPAPSVLQKIAARRRRDLLRALGRVGSAQGAARLDLISEILTLSLWELRSGPQAGTLNAAFTGEPQNETDRGSTLQ